MSPAPVSAAEIASRIARARTSEATESALTRLSFRTFADLLDARAQLGNRPYLVYYDDAGVRTELSYEAFVERVAARATALATRAGVRRGDRVATLMHNHPEAPITCFAAWRLGATVVPVNVTEDDVAASPTVQLPPTSSRAVAI